MFTYYANSGEDSHSSTIRFHQPCRTVADIAKSVGYSRALSLPASTAFHVGPDLLGMLEFHRVRDLPNGHPKRLRVRFPALQESQ